MKKADATLDLAKRLISIPSYVGEDCDEQKIGEFIFDYLKQFKWLKVSKQRVTKKRFNIIAKDGYPTKILFCGHLDTVQPRAGWTTNPFQPTVKNRKLFGLGATDMKGNLAALLSNIPQAAPIKGVGFLFYIDEEYDFLGMKKFIKEYKDKIRPKLMISADGGDLSIGYGCKGLIEVSGKVQGISGHAARPWTGNNALSGSSKAIEKLTEELKSKFKNTELGFSTCNLAFMQGGLNLGQDSQGNIRIGKEGNNIADFAEFVLDIRPTAPELNAQRVISLLEGYLKNEGLNLRQVTVRHDLGSWLTEKRSLKPIKNSLKKYLPGGFRDIKSGGYIDIQMLWSCFDKVPCLMLGAGENVMAHKPNEYIEISKLNTLKEAFGQLMEILSKGGEHYGN
ncbi:hypothetical protein A2631_00885 [Candidatus Daviesbacteria bacterium RIFCSPHIGHO2_01_FULL_44_29]|uniref:Peptidase M20 dimerisation domain-containing protein n=1 Tax=Candidatus Daviesbacteria bacterium RIFCSPHIGHO2_02_FULL_43_12 TaxID=1797776 RepID=A0A1F5KHG6_9BACT|nr:MAG: hypothetical protein A2631_00885 [Candidatus Daviesbacteria bacterium RIFCSPHIGHO2_01_FULL_44_29]OGE39299.1 MAG: hypothetical protein A3E86_00645 [Candidatus Daviesbacteria bacterium RIFCSPHIGHO2_12_FULL_47_45]OGE40274.1 MAG: hypothetical protein A3D25_05350 [Candidatus Daviesbacteria bacterium RIFCSPHIGHO2_02_FULL_43_12]OGE69073.1 MAG: hypothetical protein A3B55_02430 [Candidatus Daviesbacteria bacterium RIFCSPLOWO2_01_FULL_43_15]